jgi:energy-coupling factor transport system ATP-binding protein
VFQNPDNQIIGQVVEEDVAFGPENMGVPTAEIRTRVDEALRAVGMYEHREDDPNRLSGGQKQRVSIAGVIAMRPKCIILDEPTAMLDPKGRAEVLRAAIRLNHEEGITIILSGVNDHVHKQLLIGGIEQQMDPHNICANIHFALRRAEDILEKENHKS